MTNTTYNKIIKNTKTKLEKLSKKNGWLWFYNLHQKEVIKFAEKLLKIYKKADKKIVIIACWLHDIAHYYARNSEEILEVKELHHVIGAKIAENFLKSYELSPEEISRIN
jgi:putative nucleotidyltransferase with HDIG domain